MDRIETKYLARARHAQAVVEAFADEIEEICDKYEMGLEIRKELKKAVKLARMSIRKPTGKKAEPLPNPAALPETEFPSVGPPGEELYRQGHCKVCNLLLMGPKPIRRDYCYVHAVSE